MKKNDDKNTKDNDKNNKEKNDYDNGFRDQVMNKCRDDDDDDYEKNNNNTGKVLCSKIVDANDSVKNTDDVDGQ